MTTQQAADLVGFASPHGICPGFLVPVYQQGDDYVLQSGQPDRPFIAFQGERGTLLSTATCETLLPAIDASGGPPRCGLERLAYHLPSGAILYGRIVDLKNALAERFFEITDDPFAATEVAEFIGDPLLFVKSAEEAASALRHTNDALADEWHKHILHEAKKSIPLIALLSKDQRFKEELLLSTLQTLEENDYSCRDPLDAPTTREIVDQLAEAIKFSPNEGLSDALAFYNAAAFALNEHRYRQHPLPPTTRNSQDETVRDVPQPKHWRREADIIRSIQSANNICYGIDFVLIELTGRTETEAAAYTQRSVNDVRRRLHDQRADLKKAMQ